MSDDKASSSQSAKKHLRGSSVMLFGKLIAMVIGLVTQTVIVRALTKEDYGSFAYVLSLLLLGTSIAKLSMDKALSRFVPIYLEKGDLSRVGGVIRFVFVANLLAGGALVGMTLLLAPRFMAQGPALSLLTFLAILAPIEALENGFQKLLAIFARPRSLMFRRHVLGPLLKLAAAVPLLLVDANVMLLGYCYLAARVLGVAVSFVMTRDELKKAGALAHLRHGERPIRELLAFSLPLTALDVSAALRTSLVSLAIEFIHGAIALASYRAVLPISRLNLVVSDSCRFLYTPALARLYAKQDRKQIENLYWTNAAWIAALTFPIFIVSCLFAQPLVVRLFGQRYEDAGGILALLALASYINASFGFNTVTMQTLGMVRAVTINGILASIASVIFLALLIPPYGAWGGALAVALSQMLQNGMNQIALYREGTVRGISWKHLRAYVCLAVGTVGLVALKASGVSTIFLGIIAAPTALCVLRICARTLDAESVFPEIQRFALVRMVLGSQGDSK